MAASPWWLFMSDACTAEMPSALALIGFVAVARRTGGWGREWWAGVLGSGVLPAADGERGAAGGVGAGRAGSAALETRGVPRGGRRGASAGMAGIRGVDDELRRVRQARVCVPAGAIPELQRVILREPQIPGSLRSGKGAGHRRCGGTADIAERSDPADGDGRGDFCARRSYATENSRAYQRRWSGCTGRDCSGCRGWPRWQRRAVCWDCFCVASG